MTGTLRMTFGHDELLVGFDFLIAVIGLFGIGEILLVHGERAQVLGHHRQDPPRTPCCRPGRSCCTYWVTSIRSCIVGCWMGITPGGATPASFMSYGLAKRFSKSGDNFGKGEIEGVVAPETAAHAAGTSALLPMLTLGIPGSPTAAVLLGGLMIWGLQPGPMLFVEQKDFVWGLIASMYLGNIVGLIVVLTCVPLFAAILRVPFSIIAPVILVICAVGAYTVHNSHVRRVDDAGVRRGRLRVPEARLSAAAAGAGDRAGRQGRGIVPPGHARLAGQPDASSGRTGWSARS